MSSESKVFLLLRTHNRPEEFNRCIESISKQSVLPEIIIISDDPNDSYVDDVAIDNDIFRPKKLKRKWWIRHHNPYNDYINQGLLLIPDGNFVIILDDDDKLLFKDWVKIIIKEDVDVLIGKFKMGGDHNFKIIGDKINRGDIGTTCFAIRSEIAKQFNWPQRSGGDYNFIQKITMKYSPVFIDHIVGGVQNNLNQSWRK